MRHNICWKWKATLRGRKNRKLHKKIKELEKSRDSWKSKAMKAKEELKKNH